MLRRLLLTVAVCALGCGMSAATADGGIGDAGDEPPSTTTGAVQVIVEPSDNAAALLSAVQNAQTSIHVTMYLLTNNQFINTLIAKKNAGLDVQVVLNQTFPTPTSPNNDAVFAQLQGAGVDVVWASSAFNFTHAKCVIVDAATAWIMTMNVTFSSPSQNREYLAIDTDPDDVAEAEAVFQADHALTTANVVGKLLVAPVNARGGVLGLVQNAASKLDLEGESLSDATLVPSLVDAKNRGVAVRVVLSDSTPSNAMATAVQTLQASGIPVNKVSTPYIHSKAIVADDALAYVGSANFTQNSLDSNREIGLVISNPSEVAKVEAAIDADFTAGVTY